MIEDYCGNRKKILLDICGKAMYSRMTPIMFEYDRMVDAEIPVPNRPGWGHLAFKVDDVAAALRAVVTAGGSRLGEVVTFEVADAGTIIFTYARDPEGNIIELQSWS